MVLCSVDMHTEHLIDYDHSQLSLEISSLCLGAIHKIVLKPQIGFTGQFSPMTIEGSFLP